MWLMSDSPLAPCQCSSPGSVQMTSPLPMTWASPERLATTYQAIAEAQELDPKWDPTKAFDLSLLPK